MNFKVGDTITDGWNTYVYVKDHYWRFVTSGNHAKYHYTPKEVSKILDDCQKRLVKQQLHWWCSIWR